MKDTVIYCLAFFHMISFGFLAVGEGAKIKFADGQVNLSFFEAP